MDSVDTEIDVAINIDEHQAANLALRRRLIDAEHNLRALMAKFPAFHRYPTAFQTRRINAASALVGKIRVQLESHSNLLAELGRFPMQES